MGSVEAVCVVADTHPCDQAVMGAVCAALLSLSKRGKNWAIDL